MRTASTQHEGRVGQHSDAGTSPMVLQQPRRTGHTEEPAASERPGDGADWVEVRPQRSNRRHDQRQQDQGQKYTNEGVLRGRKKGTIGAFICM